MRTFETIVLHCAATPPNMDVNAVWIDKIHRARGWSQIGYHYVVTRSGEVERGRPVWMQGAHVKGYNASTIGICYAGGVDADGKPEDNITAAQVDAVRKLVTKLREVFGWMDLKGHRDLPNVRKACPSFDAATKFGKTFCNGKTKTTD